MLWCVGPSCEIGYYGVALISSLYDGEHGQCCPDVLRPELVLLNQTVRRVLRIKLDGPVTNNAILLQGWMDGNNLTCISTVLRTHQLPVSNHTSKYTTWRN